MEWCKHQVNARSPGTNLCGATDLHPGSLSCLFSVEYPAVSGKVLQMLSTERKAKVKVTKEKSKEGSGVRVGLCLPSPKGGLKQTSAPPSSHPPTTHSQILFFPHAVVGYLLGAPMQVHLPASIFISTAKRPRTPPGVDMRTLPAEGLRGSNV